MGRLIVSVSQNAVVQAESAILGCDQCRRGGATAPFWRVLDSIRNSSDNDIKVVYILPILATCPSCGAAIDEITLVEPRENERGLSGLSRISGSKSIQSA
jgi:hypothetical protein